MKVFLTGATGFIGGGMARALRERGDEVVALVRTPAKAAALRELGCALVEGDLGDRDAITGAIAGCDAVIHGAAIYEVGIPRSKRPAMEAANVQGTENVLGAALQAEVPKVVYISTVAVFGDTKGKVVDEGHRHSGEFCSYYEETKHRAHQVAKRLVDDGLPCVIVQPGGVYGPQDHSALGDLIKRFAAGRLPALVMPDLGFTLVHRDDVVRGTLLALDHGRIGESYVLGGDITTMGGMIGTLAEVLGRRPPRLTIPTLMLKASAPLGPVIGPLLGFPPNLREMIRSSDGVTYWASHEKAARELGYEPRPLAQGLRDTLEAEGMISTAA